MEATINGITLEAMGHGDAHLVTQFIKGILNHMEFVSQ